MPMMLVFRQILCILLYILVGYVAGKIHWIGPELRKDLTTLCANLILPFTILSSSRQTLDAQGFKNLGIAVTVILLVFGLTLAVSLLIHRLRRSGNAIRAASTGLVTFPNCTFLGLPLCQALFGDMGILYNVAALLVFNVLFFAVQYALFTGERFHLRLLLTPGMISTLILIPMLLLQIHFPDPVQTVVGNIGSMITPLSLIIIGVMMSENRLVSLLTEKKAYMIVVIRNLVIPLLACLLLRIVPLESMEKLCVLIYIACPCATLTSLYAIKADKEPELCGRTVLMSTLFFAVTLPLIIAAGQRILNVT